MKPHPFHRGRAGPRQQGTSERVEIVAGGLHDVGGLHGRPIIMREGVRAILRAQSIRNFCAPASDAW